MRSANTQSRRVKQKALFQELKKVLKSTWSFESDILGKEDGVAIVPSNFKKLTIQNNNIVLQQPLRENLEFLGESYDWT